MIGKFVDMLSNGDDLSIQVTFKGCKRFNSITRIPNWGRRHAKYFRSVLKRDLKVFAHDAVVCVVFPCVVTFVENHKSHLKEGEIFLSQKGESLDKPYPYSRGNVSEY